MSRSKPKIDGVRCAMILRGAVNGEYCLLFERRLVSLEQIEAINWARPELTGNFDPLPEGYGFEVAGITYSSSDQTYRVQLRVLRQYLGDVTGYQAKVSELEGTVSGLEGTISELEGTVSNLESTVSGLEGTVSELEGVVSQQRETIETKEDVIRLQEDTIQTQQDTITTQQQTITQQLEEIQSQYVDILAKDQTIARQSEEIQSQQADILAKDQTITRQAEEIRSQQADILEKDQTIQTQQTEIQSYTASVAGLIGAVVSVAAISTELPDELALDMAVLAPGCFPTWEDVLRDGVELAQGRVLEKDGQLYRVVQPVTPQAHQEPGGEGMLAVYRPIDREHAGTVEDPIPWVYGMDCLAGLCYSYEGAVYQVAEGGNMVPCVWAPDTPGLWQWELVKEAG